MIILDTDCVSLLERDNEDTAVLRKHLAAVPPHEVVTTIITFEEQMRGWLAFLAKAKTLENQVSAYNKLSRFLDNYGLTDDEMKIAAHVQCYAFLSSAPADRPSRAR